MERVRYLEPQEKQKTRGQDQKYFNKILSEGDEAIKYEICECIDNVSQKCGDAVAGYYDAENAEIV